MLFTQRSTLLLPAALVVASSFLTLASATPSSMQKRDVLTRRGDAAMEAANVKNEDATKPPPNPADQPKPEVGPTGLYILTFNTDPMTSVNSVVNFDTTRFGGKKESGWGGFCSEKDTYGCLAGDNGSGGVYTVIYQCSEIDSSESAKKAYVWKKSSTCKDTRTGYNGISTQTNVCKKDGNGATCKPFADK